MNNTEKELTIFIQDWIYRLDKSGELTVFTGIEALYNNKQKMYHGGEREYKFVAETVPQLADACRGDLYRIMVKEERDPRYGYQWRVVSAKREETVLIHEIRKFLTQLREKCLTYKRRDALIKAYGAQVFDAILTNPSALDVIEADPGSKRRIHRVIAENRGFANLLAFLAKRKWDCRWAAPLYKHYEDNAIRKLRTDPYRLYQHGLAGFKAADRVFLDNGGSVSDPLRCWRAVLAALCEEEKRNGGTFIPRGELRRKIAPLLWDTDSDAKTLNCTISEDDISKALDWLEDCHQIHIDRVCGSEDIYLSPLYQAEISVANGLKALCQAKKSVTCSGYKIDQFLAEYGSTNGVELTSSQQAAVKQMLTAPVSIVTGGPGTGKTLLVKAAIDTMRELRSPVFVQCCAPTGKASVRMPAEAQTIDRLVENEKWRKVNRTCKGDPDIFLVDEVSMISLELFARLLQIIPAGARLVLIGDKDQLPSVEAGQVLRDLIESGVIRTIRLQERFRQEENSDIPIHAEKVIQTAADQDIKLAEKGAGFAFNTHLTNPHRIPDAVIKSVELVQRSGIPLKDIQIICRTKNGEYGTKNLNRLMQDHFNFQEEENKFYYGGKEFRLNDRVIHVKNNYDLDVMNGEAGVIIEINHTKEHALTVQYPARTVRYAEKELEELELAYALTAHKCQGSEYRAVIIPIAGRGITRRWLYTAVTRGRQLVLLIGTEAALTAKKRGETTDERASRLALRLQRSLPPILPEMEQTSLFSSAQN